jgi:hypothetical protein
MAGRAADVLMLHSPEEQGGQLAANLPRRRWYALQRIQRESVAPEHQFSTDNPGQGRNAAMGFFILIASVRASVSGGPHAGCQFPRHSIHFQQHPYRLSALRL